MQTENPNIKQSSTTFHIHLYQSLHSKEKYFSTCWHDFFLFCANGTLFTANTPSEEKSCKRHVFDDLLLLLISKIKIEKWRMKAFVAWCTKLYAQLKWSYELMIKKEGIYCNEPPTHSTIECLGGTRESLDLPRHDTSRAPLHLKVTKRSRVVSFKKFRFLFNMRTFYRWIK